MGDAIEMDGNGIGNGGDSIRIEWNSIEMGGVRIKIRIKYGGDFIGIAKDSIKSAENSIRMGLRCSGMARAEGCGVRVVRTFTRFGLTPFYVGELVRFSWENNIFCNS